jgi:DNA replication protein DnaC
MTTNNEPEQTCPICGGSTWISFKDDKGFWFTKACKCRSVEIAKTRIKASGISKIFYAKNFENFQDYSDRNLARMKETARDYATKFPVIKDSEHNSLLLMGQSGSGKTHLTMAVANAIMEQHMIGVTYMEYREEVTKLKQLVNAYDEYTREIERMKRAECLLIDDFLKGKITDSDINVVFDIVNYRYFNCLPMIISTEKTISELQDYDEAVASRILERATGHIIRIEGKSYNHRFRSVSKSAN